MKTPIISWIYRFKPGYSPLNNDKITRQNITWATVQPNYPAEFRQLSLSCDPEQPMMRRRQDADAQKR
jgi:hypothetical protein